MNDRVVELLGGQKNFVRSATVGSTQRDRRASERSKGNERSKGKMSAREFKTAVGNVFLANRAARLKTRAIGELSAHLIVPEDEILMLLDIRGRTAQRRQQTGELSDVESDRLYRIARVTQKAEIAFGSEAKARDWLKRPNRMFDGATPISLLASDAGAEAVTDELTRIEFGDLY